MQKNILITKASGEQATYDPEKLRRSLRRAGAGEEVVDAIEKEIGQLLYPGMTTKKIYRRAFSLLKKASAHVAAKYKLKKALQQLGPAGYPFEKYVGEIFRHEGYEVQVGQIV